MAAMRRNKSFANTVYSQLFHPLAIALNFKIYPMKHLTLFILILIGLSSCENLLVKDIELEDINYSKKLVLNSVLLNHSDTLILTLSENISVLETPDYDIKSIDGANVILYEDGNEVGVFEKPAGYEYYFLAFGEELDASGKNYTVSIESPDYPNAEASTKMPIESLISSVEYIENAGISPDLRKLPGIRIKFTDPAEEENYYVFNVQSTAEIIDTFIFGNDTTFYNYELYIDAQSNDPLVEQGYRNEYLSDGSFNGKEYTLTILLDNGGFEDVDLSEYLGTFTLRWISASKEYYNFDKSLSRYYQNSGFGLFSEPVSIFSNVEGGIGVFSSLNLQEISF
jgi:hypothetical protein